jgi:hypothetical protein
MGRSRNPTLSSSQLRSAGVIGETHARRVRRFYVSPATKPDTRRRRMVERAGERVEVKTGIIVVLRSRSMREFRLGGWSLEWNAVWKILDDASRLRLSDGNVTAIVGSGSGTLNHITGETTSACVVLVWCSRSELLGRITLNGWEGLPFDATLPIIMIRVLVPTLRVLALGLPLRMIHIFRIHPLMFFLHPVLVLHPRSFLLFRHRFPDFLSGRAAISVVSPPVLFHKRRAEEDPTIWGASGTRRCVFVGSCRGLPRLLRSRILFGGEGR